MNGAPSCAKWGLPDIKQRQRLPSAVTCCPAVRGARRLYLHRRRRQAAAGSPQSKSRRPPRPCPGTAVYRARRLQRERARLRPDAHQTSWFSCSVGTGPGKMPSGWTDTERQAPQARAHLAFPRETPRVRVRAPRGCCSRSQPCPDKSGACGQAVTVVSWKRQGRREWNSATRQRHQGTRPHREAGPWRGPLCPPPLSQAGPLPQSHYHCLSSGCHSPGSLMPKLQIS